MNITRQQKNYTEERVNKAKENLDILEDMRGIFQMYEGLMADQNVSWIDLARVAGEGTAENVKTLKNASEASINPQTFGSSPRLWSMKAHFKFLGVSFGRVNLAVEDLGVDNIEEFIRSNRDNNLARAINDYKIYSNEEIESSCAILKEEIIQLKNRLIDTDDFDEEEKLTKEMKSRRASLKVLTNKTKN